MRRVYSFTVVTLQVLDLELSHKGLLDLRISHYLFLYSQLDLQLARMRLRPDKLGVN